MMAFWFQVLCNTRNHHISFLGCTVNSLLYMCFDHQPPLVAYHSDFFNGTFDLGKSFLSHIDDDTLDLVSTEIFDCGYYKYL